MQERPLWRPRHDRRTAKCILKICEPVCEIQLIRFRIRIIGEPLYMDIEAPGFIKRGVNIVYILGFLRLLCCQYVSCFRWILLNNMVFESRGRCSSNDQLVPIHIFTAVSPIGNSNGLHTFNIIYKFFLPIFYYHYHSEHRILLCFRHYFNMPQPISSWI